MCNCKRHASRMSLPASRRRGQAYQHKRNASSGVSQQAAGVDENGALRAICAAVDLDALNRVHHLHPLRNPPERHVAVVCPPRVVLDGDEEPGAR